MPSADPVARRFTSKFLCAIRRQDEHRKAAVMRILTTATLGFVVTVAIAFALGARLARPFGIDLDLESIAFAYPAAVTVAAIAAGVIWAEMAEDRPGQVALLLMAVWLLGVSVAVLVTLDVLDHRGLRADLFPKADDRDRYLLAGLLSVLGTVWRCRWVSRSIAAGSESRCP
jgi:hypothetical protein